MVKLSLASSKPKKPVITRTLISQFSILSEWWLSVTGSLLCPSRAHWNTRLWQGWEVLASTLRGVLRGWVSCRSGIWVDPDLKVRIVLEPGLALRCQPTANISLLLAESGSQECRNVCTPVTQKRRYIRLYVCLKSVCIKKVYLNVTFGLPM